MRSVGWPSRGSIPPEANCQHHAGNLSQLAEVQIDDASTDDLGVETFDLVYTSSLVDHLEEEENRDLARRVARALRPGGHYVIVDSVRPRSPKETGQIGTLGDLFFALTSRAGTWSFEEIADWQLSIGLEPRKPIRLRTGPGVGVQWAVKQATS
jgi:SAM-dependent methyltransferase